MMQPPFPPPGDDMFALISELARGAKPETSMEMGRRIIGDLEKWRKRDVKAAPIISMAIDMLRHGPEGPTGEGTRESEYE